jgi:hypothetical protein
MEIWEDALISKEDHAKNGEPSPGAERAMGYVRGELDKILPLLGPTDREEFLDYFQEKPKILPDRRRNLGFQVGFRRA